MVISVKGKNSKLTKSEARKIVNWMALRLMGKRLVRNINVDLSFATMDENGFCATYDAERNPREFEVIINRDLDLDGQISAIAHEMVHVKQMARNELVMGTVRASMSKKGISMVSVGKWMGKEYEITDETYWELPWEIEAYGREVGLRYNYLKE